MAQSWMHNSLVWSLCLLIICPNWSLGQDCPEVCICTPVEDGLVAECSDNGQLSYIPGDLPSDVTVLRMQRTSLSVVSGDNLTNLVNLQHLDLSQNILEDILADAFVSLPSLKILDLGFNLLMDLKNDTFVPMTLLEVLNLQYNNIPSVPTHIFGTLGSLTWLNLDNNAIFFLLGDNPFASLSNLQYLSLNGIGLIHLGTSAFTGLDALQELYIGSNQLQELLPDVFLPLSQLQILDASDNFMKTFPNFFLFIYLPKLSVLNFDNNQFYTIPRDGFRGASHLEKLSINDNDLQLWATDCLAGLGYLKHLSMSGNRLRDWALDELQHVPNLVTLDLSRNWISYVYEKYLSNNAKLIQMNLEDNHLQCTGSNRWLARSVKEGVKWAVNWRYSTNPPMCDSPSYLLTMDGVRGYIPDLLEADIISYDDWPVVDVAAPSLTVRPGDSLMLEAILSVGVPYSQWRTPSGQIIDVRDLTLQHSNLLPSESTKIEDDMHKTIARLLIKNATVSDEGEYTVWAQNAYTIGDPVEGNIKVTVSDQSGSGGSVHMRRWISGLLLSALYLLY